MLKLPFCLFQVFGRSARVLVDTGATHSLISGGFSAPSGVPPSRDSASHPILRGGGSDLLLPALSDRDWGSMVPGEPTHIGGTPGFRRDPWDGLADDPPCCSGLPGEECHLTH